MSFNHISLNANEIKRERNKTWILLYDTSLLTCSNQNTLKITEYGFLICLCFFTKFFSIILFFFYFFLHKSKLKCFKGTCLCKFGKGLLNSLKFIHGKITTNKAKNKPIIGQVCRLTGFFFKFRMKSSPVSSSGDFLRLFQRCNIGLWEKNTSSSLKKGKSFEEKRQIATEKIKGLCKQMKLNLIPNIY